MKRILVYGYHGTSFGGLEQVLSTYISRIMETHEDITFDILVAGDTCDQEEQFRKMHCRILYYPERRKNAKAYEQRICEIFEKTRYDAVWCNVSGLTNIDLLILAKKHNVPMRIVHSHTSHLMWGNPVMRLVVPVLHHINKRRLHQYATHYWACSRTSGEFMYPKKVHSQIYVVKNAIDEAFAPNEALRDQMRQAFGLTGLTVAHVARLSKEKNQFFLLQVMGKVVERNADAKLLLVGDGDLREPLEKEVTRLGLESSVIFTGFRKDVSSLLQAADVFVLPSEAEGLGLSAIEAQSCGVPCVVSTGVPQSVDISGCVAFVSLKDTAEQWAEAVLKMAQKRVPNPQECVRKAGYGIEESARALYDILTGEAK